MQIGPYHLESQENLVPVTDGQGCLLDVPIVGQLRVVPRQPPRYEISHPTSFTFGGQIALIGYDLDKTTVKPGETLTLALYWQALHPPAAGYTVFVHLSGADRSCETCQVSVEMAGQHDSQPCGGDCPTSLWQAGEVIQDIRVVQVKPEARPGQYWLLTGLYRLETGERLPITAGSTPVAAGFMPAPTDHVLLAQISVSW